MTPRIIEFQYPLTANSGGQVVCTAYARSVSPAERGDPPAQKHRQRPSSVRRGRLWPLSGRSSPTATPIVVTSLVLALVQRSSNYTAKLPGSNAVFHLAPSQLSLAIDGKQVMGEELLNA
jgi:hypothetical protein